MSDAPAPCPHCGVDLVRHHSAKNGGTRWQHPNDDCISAAIFLFSDKSITKWNRRAPDPFGLPPAWGYQVRLRLPPPSLPLSNLPNRRPAV